MTIHIGRIGAPSQGIRPHDVDLVEALRRWHRIEHGGAPGTGALVGAVPADLADLFEAQSIACEAWATLPSLAEQYGDDSEEFEAGVSQWLEAARAMAKRLPSESNDSSQQVRSQNYFPGANEPDEAPAQARQLPTIRSAPQAPASSAPRLSLGSAPPGLRALFSKKGPSKTAASGTGGRIPLGNARSSSGPRIPLGKIRL